MGSEQNVGFAHGPFRGNEGRDALIEKIAVEFRHAGLSARFACQEGVEANHHREAREVRGHHFARTRGVGAKRVVVESTRGFEHFGRERPVGGEELLVLVETHAHGETVDGLALRGRGHHELVRVFEKPHGFGSDRHVGLAFGNGPGVFDRQAGPVERDGGGTRSGAGDPLAVVVRGVRIRFGQVLGLFREILVGAVAGEAGLVRRHDEGVAGDGVFLRVAGGAVRERRASGFDFDAVSAVLFGYGLANIVGNVLAGRFFGKARGFFSLAVPLAMFGAYALLYATAETRLAAAGLVLGLGVAAGFASIVGQNLIATAARRAPDLANGLFLSAANFGTALGTAFCGIFIGWMGTKAALFGTLLMLILAFVLVALRLRADSIDPEPAIPSATQSPEGAAA